MSHPSDTSASDPNALPARRIEVSALSCRRGERLLFSGLDFAVGAGEALLLRGPNGVGKTTLLLALAGIVRPEAGRISFGGRDVEDRPGTDLHLLGHLPGLKKRLSVAENLAFWTALNGGGTRLIERALAAVGLAALSDLDAGYLSAGQTRRLALARLLTVDRPIWLLDEPTAALDAEGEQLVGILIDAHLKRHGIVVAATHHDLKLHAEARINTLRLAA